jgi:hypothetical protein
MDVNLATSAIHIKPTYSNRDQDRIQRIDAKLRDTVAYYSPLSE